MTVLRRSLLAAGVIVVVILAALLWLLYRGLQTQHDLDQIRGTLSSLQGDVRNGAPLAQQQAELTTIQKDVNKARSNTHDPIWTIGAAIPVLGSPLHTARSLSSIASSVTNTALPDVLKASTALQTLRNGADNGQLPLAPLQASAPALHAASASLDKADDQLATLKGSWFGRVAHARDSVSAELGSIRHEIDVASTAVDIAPGMLGSSGTRNYFVAFENPAEARGGGGNIGGYALVSATNGKISLSKIGGEQDLPALKTDPPGLNTEWLNDYSDYDAARDWTNTDLSANFPSTGAAWAAMYHQDFGTQVDGVLALDPVGLSTFLQFTGAVTVDGQLVTSANVVHFLEVDEYNLDLTVAQRKNILSDIGSAVFKNLITKRVAAQPLFAGIAHDALGQHVELWSAHATEQASLGHFPIAAVLPVTTAPFLLPLVTDAGTEKLDTYLHESIGYTVSSCTTGQRTVTATVDLTNEAPTTPLPAYISTRKDDPGYAIARNQELTLLSVLLTDKTGFISATIDGKPLPLDDDLSGDAQGLASSVELGHPTLSAFVELPPGKTRHFVFVLSEPPSNSRPTIPLQSLPIHPTSDVTPHACMR